MGEDGGRSQDECKRCVMEEETDFSVGSCIAFISRHRRKFVALACLAIPCGSEFYQNITSPPPNQQQQQASVRRAQENIDSGFNWAGEVLNKPASSCLIAGFIENHKTSDVWQCVMSSSGNNSR